jgi:hypothetical protein
LWTNMSKNMPVRNQFPLPTARISIREGCQIDC